MQQKVHLLNSNPVHTQPMNMQHASVWLIQTGLAMYGAVISTWIDDPSSELVCMIMRLGSMPVLRKSTNSCFQNNISTTTHPDIGSSSATMIFDRSYRPCTRRSLPQKSILLAVRILTGPVTWSIARRLAQRTGFDLLKDDTTFGM